MPAGFASHCILIRPCLSTAIFPAQAACIIRADMLMQALLYLHREKDEALAAAQTDRESTDKWKSEWLEMQRANATLQTCLSTVQKQVANVERLFEASSKASQQFQKSMVEEVKVNFGLAGFWASMSEQHPHLRFLVMSACLNVANPQSCSLKGRSTCCQKSEVWGATSHPLE